MSEARTDETVSSPPDLAIRARPPSPKRLSRKVLLGGVLSVAAIVACAVLFGLSGKSDRPRPVDTQNAAAGAPESVLMAPDAYGASDLAASDEAASDTLEPPEDSIWSGGAAAQSAPPAPGPAPPDPETIARSAPILFTTDPDAASPDAARASMGRHGAFLAAQSRSGERLEARLAPPRSRYEVLAGAVIPAALQSELNSDLPGRVIAQVTAPVFDSVSGRYLLIPQGARLIGAYDSETTYGDRRLLLVWNRLILPNGWSIGLEGMDGADASGAAGVRDRTDNHLGRLTGAVALSAIISVVANESEDDEEEGSLSQSVGDAAAQEAARSGGRIIDRELSVQPTLRVRAGAPVRVLVTRDIALRPYRE
jgi:type IV secretory pathway VirB10-like protein